MNWRAEDQTERATPLPPHAFLESIRAFMAERNPERTVRNVQMNTNLVDEGLLDSFKVIELINQREGESILKIHVSGKSAR